MNESTNNPLDELKQINKAIKQYEVVLKTTRDPMQKQRVSKELSKLKNYREKFEHVYSIVEEESDPGEWNEFDGFRFLSQNVTLDDETEGRDREVIAIRGIIRFFEKEFLAFLTERKLKLDFKYSLERDSFYHLFQDLMKRIMDFEDEVKIINEGKYTEKALSEIKNRRLRKRRVLIIETDRLFRRCRHFTREIITDIEKGGVSCLNHEDTLHFERLEGIRFLEGMTVHDALLALDTFAGEIIAYLNLPEIVVQEQ
ncbi:MAG TPA: hypothetical protein ENN69_08710 [Spirochaetia bacterium]|nr:hypothetical protein [Spirochaetia bacterium]